MGRDTIQLENVVSTISQEYLLEFTSKYGIPKSLHPELSGPENLIVEFSEGKVGVYTKFFEFANFRWMSFSKRPDKNTPQCYTKPLDSLKNWNNRFFWVDAKVFPIVVDWRTNALKDEMPSADSYSVVAVATLKTRRTPIQKQPEALLCLVGLSQNYFLGDDVLACSLLMRFRPLSSLPVVLVAFSFGALVDTGSFPSLRILDPRSDPAEGSSSLSASSRRLFNSKFSISIHNPWTMARLQ
nr:transposase (putative), gypsy type [Tanacetum cinerariifolium]